MENNLRRSNSRQRIQRRPRYTNPHQYVGDRIQSTNTGIAVDRFSRRVRTRYTDDVHGTRLTTSSYHNHVQGSDGGSNPYLTGNQQQQVFGSSSTQGGNLSGASSHGHFLPFAHGIYALGRGYSQNLNNPASLPNYSQTQVGTSSNVGIPLPQSQNFQRQQETQNQQSLPSLHDPQHSNTTTLNEESVTILRQLLEEYVIEFLANHQREARRNQSQEMFPHQRSNFREDLGNNLDSMSYEELLGLQETIGNVNTGLSEEAISRALRTRTYLSSDTDQSSEICVVCQEEYENEETVGALHCGHDYHESCIKDWLRLKNTCPLCKSHASPTSG